MRTTTHPAAVRRHRRAMTLVELLVVLAITALIMAVALPRLLGSESLGLDQQAKTTASGALDTVTSSYARASAHDPWDRATWDADADAADRVADEADGTLDGLGRLTDEEKIRVVRRVPVAPTVTEAHIEGRNPDVDVTDGPTVPSRDVTEVSVGRHLVDPGGPDAYWVVGAAVRAPVAGQGDGGACWMVQRALNPPVGTPTETYLVFLYDTDDPETDPAANPTLPDTDECTGTIAAHLDTSAIRLDPPNGDTVKVFDAGPTPRAPVLRGGAWDAPMFVGAAHVTTAAADAAGHTSVDHPAG